MLALNLYLPSCQVEDDTTTDLTDPATAYATAQAGARQTSQVSGASQYGSRP